MELYIVVVVFFPWGGDSKDFILELFFFNLQIYLGKNGDAVPFPL